MFLIESIIALAAEAADEAPRAAIISAPRFCTLGMKVFFNHSLSLMTLVAFSLLILAE